MDAPAPSNEDESELTESNATNFSQENKNYTLKHSLSPTNIIFDLLLDNKEIYEKQYTFNEIVKMNRYFLICESLKDIYDELSSLIDNKKFSIYLQNNEILLRFSLPSQKLKEVDFVLIKKNKLAQEDVSNLNERIDKQDKVIRNQNIRICSLEYQLNNNNEVVKNLEDKLKKLEAFLYENINRNKDISDSKKNMFKIDDNKNNVIKVNSNKYKIKSVNKEEEDISDDITESNNMSNAHIENKNIKNSINIQDNNNIIKKDVKEEKNERKDKMNNISIDSNEDENNNDEDINDDKDKENNNDEESNNNEENDEEEDSVENKINNNNVNNNVGNKIIEDNRNGEITIGLNYNDNKNKNSIKEKENNNEKECDSIEENSNNEETNFNKEDDSYFGDKDIIHNKEDNIEESSYTMDNNIDYDISGYKKIICKKYINFEESSYNTEDNVHIIRHEDYKSSSIMKITKKNYIPDEDVNINISNLEEDFSVSVNENEENIIINKLKKIIGRNCSLDLIYQMTRDGNRTIDFHKKADIKSPTLVLFKTNDGYNFGGYTSKSFKSSGGWIKDPDSFLFNLNNMNKFKIKNGSESSAIFYGNASKYGPEFYDILINSGEVQYGTIYPSNFLDKVEDLKEGEADFTCIDVLVYRVNFM